MILFRFQVRLFESPLSLFKDLLSKLVKNNLKFSEFYLKYLDMIIFSQKADIMICKYFNSDFSFFSLTEEKDII